MEQSIKLKENLSVFSDKFSIIQNALKYLPKFQLNEIEKIEFNKINETLKKCEKKIQEKQEEIHKFLDLKENPQKQLISAEEEINQIQKNIDEKNEELKKWKEDPTEELLNEKEIKNNENEITKMENQIKALKLKKEQLEKKIEEEKKDKKIEKAIKKSELELKKLEDLEMDIKKKNASIIQKQNTMNIMKEYADTLKISAQQIINAENVLEVIGFQYTNAERETMQIGDQITKTIENELAMIKEEDINRYTSTVNEYVTKIDEERKKLDSKGMLKKINNFFDLYIEIYNSMSGVCNIQELQKQHKELMEELNKKENELKNKSEEKLNNEILKLEFEKKLENLKFSKQRIEEELKLFEEDENFYLDSVKKFEIKEKEINSGHCKNIEKWKEESEDLIEKISKNIKKLREEKEKTILEFRSNYQNEIKKSSEKLTYQLNKKYQRNHYYICIDKSSSMYSVWPVILQVFTNFITGLKENKRHSDLVTIIVYDSAAKTIISSVKVGDVDMKKSLSSVSPSGGTNFSSAIKICSTLREQNKDGNRSMIIFFTDGGDGYYKETIKEVKFIKNYTFNNDPVEMFILALGNCFSQGDMTHMDQMVKIINGSETYQDSFGINKKYVSIHDDGVSLGTQLAEIAKYDTTISKDIEFEQILLKENINMKEKASIENFDAQILLLEIRFQNVINDKQFNEEFNKKEKDKFLELLIEEKKENENRLLNIKDKINEAKKNLFDDDFLIEEVLKRLDVIKKRISKNEDDISKIEEELRILEEERVKSKKNIKEKYKENKKILIEKFNFGDETQIEKFFEYLDCFFDTSRNLLSGITQIEAFIESLKLNYKFYGYKLDDLKRYSNDIYKYALLKEKDEYMKLNGNFEISEMIYSKFLNKSDFELEQVQEIVDRNYHIQIMKVKEDARYDKIEESIEAILEVYSKELKQLKSSIAKLEKSDDTVDENIILDYEKSQIETHKNKIKEYESKLFENGITNELKEEYESKLKEEFAKIQVLKNKIDNYQNNLSKKIDKEREKENKLKELEEKYELNNDGFKLSKKKLKKAFNAIINYMEHIGLEYKRKDSLNNLEMARKCLSLNNDIMRNIKAIGKK